MSATAGTLAAIERIPRPPLYTVGFYRVAGTTVDAPVGWDDVARDTAWAADLLVGYGVVAGDVVVPVSGGHEMPWFGPFIRATLDLGATYAPTETMGFDAHRTALYTRILRPRVVMGVSAEVAAALDAAGTLGGLAAVDVVVARADACDRLRAAGIDPLAMALVGPAFAIECRARRGLHINGAEWAAVEHGGEIHLTTMAERRHRLDDAAVGVAGAVATGRCACGRDDPRIMLR